MRKLKKLKHYRGWHNLPRVVTDKNFDSSGNPNQSEDMRFSAGLYNSMIIKGFNQENFHSHLNSEMQTLLNLRLAIRLPSFLDFPLDNL